MTKTKIINLTPHFIRIERDGEEVKIKSGFEVAPARIDLTERPTGRKVEVEGVEVPIVRQEVGDVTNLPEPKKGTYLIVSLVVAQALPERSDLLYPAGLIRNDAGQVTGCKALGTFHKKGKTSKS